MKNSIHRISNLSDADVDFTVFRFVSPNENHSNIIKTDKKIYSDKELEVLKNDRKSKGER